MISSALISIVLVCTMLLIQSTNRYARLTNASIEIHDEALNAINHLVREIRESDLGSIDVSSTPAGVSFGSAMDANSRIKLDSATQKIIWTKRVCFYLDTQSGVPVLVRKEQALTTPTTNVPATGPTSSPNYFKTLAVGSQVVGRHITTFEIIPAAVVKINLTATNQVEGKDFAVTIRTEVNLRN
jgi:hypothetical protein